jgi:hypothetical protein
MRESGCGGGAGCGLLRLLLVPPCPKGIACRGGSV